MKNLPKIVFTRYRAMLIPVYILALLLLLAPPAISEVLQMEGEATGNLYHKDSFKWTEEPIRVFAVYDKTFIDDITYVVGGKGDYETRGLLFELGQPGRANTENRYEREKFLNLLKKSQAWLVTATTEQVRETRYLSRIFISFDIDLVPGQEGRENTLRIKIKDHTKKRRLTLHLNAYQVGQLITLLEQVPDAFTSMAEMYGERSLGGGGK